MYAPPLPSACDEVVVNKGVVYVWRFHTPHPPFIGGRGVQITPRDLPNMYN
jgi:hypothetical protein